MSEARLGPVDDTARVHRAGVARELAAAVHQQQGGDARDAEARGEGRGGIGVELEQPDLRLELLRRALEHGGHRAARTAPWRPYVDQQRNVAVGDVTRESLLVDFDGVAGEDRLMARAAARALRRAFGRQAVCPPAMPANDLACRAHVPVRTSLIFAILSLSSTKRS